MSCILSQSAASPTGLTGMLQGNDERINPSSYQWYGVGMRTLAPWADGFLWPNSRMSGGDPTVPMSLAGVDSNNTAKRWELHPDEGGSQAMKKIIGTTRDASGNPLGTCVVKGYLTSNDQFLRQLTSDANGYFEFCSEFSGAAHYLVGYRPGSPDVEGTTVNTLVPV